MTIHDPRDASDASRPTDAVRLDDVPSLDDLRVEIDRIDTELHGLLLDRGKIIDRLIAVKARQGGGSAFRPGREAEMMRRLVTRHSGILPLDTIESIWRIIIATFTYVQAPYGVHADVAAGDPAMRDSCRFHFGFTVPLTTHDGAMAVIAAVAEASGDLGIIRADGPMATPWWEALADPAAPKIIARLPFVERADRAAGLPLYVVARPLADPSGGDVALYAVTRAAATNANDASGIAIVATCAVGDRIAALVRAPIAETPETVARALGVPRATLAWVGSHARRFEIDEAKTSRSQPR